MRRVLAVLAAALPLLAVAPAGVAAATAAKPSPAPSAAAARPTADPAPAARDEGAPPIGVLDGTPYSTARVVVPMVFPVLGGASYEDTFLACRGTGCSRMHMGQDLMAPKMRPLVAAFNGRISYLRREASVDSTGNYLSITGDTGWSVNYLHMNNDTPGTDDGRGTAAYAFAPGLAIGQRVVQGQFVGWVGDSGNAETTPPHCHCELRHGEPWSGTAYNAYPSLLAAKVLTTAATSGPHPDGSLVRGSTTHEVYVIRDGTKQWIRSRELLAANGWSFPQVFVVAPAEIVSYPNGPTAALRDGLALRDPAGALWVTYDGRRAQVSSGALAGLGIAAATVRTVSAADLATVPVTATAPSQWRNGMLVRQSGDPAVYAMVGGVLRHVPEYAVLTAYGWTTAHIRAVPAGTIGASGTPSVGGQLPPPDGRLLVADGAVWFASDGMRRWLPSWTIGRMFGYDKQPLLRLTAPTVAAMPLGPQLP